MNEPNNTQPEARNQTEQQRDDALFEALSKSKKQKKNRILRTVILLILVAALILIGGVSILRHRVRERFATMGEDVLQEQAQVGSISTLVSGSGVLSNVDAETVSVPEGVELTEILVANGDAVEAGQLLAIADQATVRSAMADLQDTIESLDDEIYDARDDKASTAVTAGVPGRVKILYGQPGDRVADVMVEHGALAVISLDGYMAADLETNLLNVHDTVTVIRSDGTEIDGVVEAVIDGTATVLVTDEGPENDETVTIRTSDGADAGNARLYVHSPLMVTAYAGTIRTLHVRENASVSRNTYLYTLTDTEFSANYDTLLRSRKEAEETLLELLKIQKHGGIPAEVSGTVFDTADLDSGEPITQLLTLSPDISMSVTISVDESDILSLQAGQDADVTVGSVGEDVLPGTVTEIDRTASDGAYTAVITLSKLSGMLPGMTADVDIKIQGSENALLVPAEAVHYTSTGAYVYTSYDAQLEEYGGRVDVVTGLSNDDYVEIISGLNPGDTVYYTESTSFFDMFRNMGNQNANRNNRTPGSNAGGRGQAPAMPQGGAMPGGRG